MGRGRAKAKQTKVARELKYSSPDMDLSALERELHGQQFRGDESAPDEYDDDASDPDESWPKRR